MDRYDHWLPKVIKSKSAPNWAITLRQTTYYSVPASLVDAPWRAHEECHKEQWRRVGTVLFAILYLWYLAIRGYQDNPYEIEARAAAARCTGNIRKEGNNG